MVSSSVYIIYFKAEHLLVLICCIVLQKAARVANFGEFNELAPLVLAFACLLCYTLILVYFCYFSGCNVGWVMV